MVCSKGPSALRLMRLPWPTIQALRFKQSAGIVGQAAFVIRLVQDCFIFGIFRDIIYPSIHPSVDP
jgi:hypothetical protein